MVPGEPRDLSGVRGVENPWMLDAIAHETRSDRIVLAIFETRPWTGGDFQRFELQEKLNAYVSFLLDGEMEETYPDLARKPAAIQLRTVHAPDAKTLSFLDLVRRQLSFQEIALEIVVIGEG